MRSSGCAEKWSPTVPSCAEMAKTFWDRWARLYDLSERTNGRAVQGMVRSVVGRIPAGAQVLECAAGTGMISAAAAAKAGHVTCTDLSLPMLERASAKAKRLGLDNISFEARDLLHLADPDDTYDITVAANVLHLLPHPEDAVREVWRVTKPGGKVILPTFLQGEARWGFRQIIRLYRLAGFRPYYQFTRQSYQAMIDGCRLSQAKYTLIQGRLPVGLAVLEKP